MLQNIHVKNLAIIEEAEVELDPRFNVLTGETGAGKSVLIGSVTFALGGKARADMIRRGADYAQVELLFEVDDRKTLDALAALDLPAEDGQVLITRRITSRAGGNAESAQTAGVKSICKVNGETVTAQTLKEVSALLLDIHGQHEHQSLLHRAKHLEILDTYAKNAALRAEVKQAYEAWTALEAESRKDVVPEEQRAREISFLDYEIEEIEGARMKRGEEDELFAAYKKMSNVRMIEEGIGQAADCISEGEESASSLVSRAVRELSGLLNCDAGLQNIYDELAQIDSMLSDAGRDLSDYADSLAVDPEVYAATEQRLDLLHELSKKYGPSYDDIAAYLADAKAKRDRLADYENYLAGLSKKLADARRTYDDAAGRLSASRSAAAAVLAGKIREGLSDLNFLTVRFEIANHTKDTPGPNGIDEPEFLIATNPGETPKPLGEVASGGELSRIMLVIKSILAEQDAIDTLIFDEIDTGISGVTAQRVAEKLSGLAKAHQVICITHLQQIAAMADNHIFVEKTGADAAHVAVRRLGEDESVRELARMLSGDHVTDATLAAARELKKAARSAPSA